MQARLCISLVEEGKKSVQTFSVTSMRISILKFYQITEQVFSTKWFSLKGSTMVFLKYLLDNATDGSNESACKANICCEVFIGEWLCEVGAYWLITQEDIIVDFYMSCNKEFKIINKNCCTNSYWLLSYFLMTLNDGKFAYE